VLDRDHLRAEVHDQVLDVDEEVVAGRAFVLARHLDVELAVRGGVEAVLAQQVDEPVAVRDACCVDVDRACDLDLLFVSRIRDLTIRRDS
jgi:hypothetical protein